MAVTVTIATQKGGSGKSTLTEIAASYLAYGKKCRVCVLDCDNPQFSLAREKEQVMAQMKNRPMSRQQMGYLVSVNDYIYPVVRSDYMEVGDFLEANGSRFDYILVDLPGSVRDRDIFWQVFAKMDVLFVPFEPDTFSLQSGSSLLVTLADIMEKTGEGMFRLRKRVGFWNKFFSGTSSGKIEEWTRVVTENVPMDMFMKNRVGNSLRIKDLRDFFRTIPDSRMAERNNNGLNLGGWLTEFYDIISKN